MLKEKGKVPSHWNWQLSADRTLDEVEQEREYLANVEKISHCTAHHEAKEEKNGAEG
jgi:hypothetical protein